MDKSNGSLFIFLEDNADEKELASFLTKMKKMRKVRKKKLKGSSLSSSPTLSSPQDSDAGSTSSVKSTNGNIADIYMDQYERSVKRKKSTNDDRNLKKVNDRPKRRKLENGIYRPRTRPNEHNSDADNDDTVIDSRPKKTVCLPKPNPWMGVQSSHYIFSSDEDSETMSETSTNRETRVVKLKAKKISKTSGDGTDLTSTDQYFSHQKPYVDTLSLSNNTNSLSEKNMINTNTVTSVAVNSSPSVTACTKSVDQLNKGAIPKRFSQLWSQDNNSTPTSAAHTSHSMSPVSNKSRRNFTQTCKQYCLTNCRSCRSYSLPTLTDSENIEMDKYVALDCEFVGVGPDMKSALGRCSIVNHWGEILFDKFVKPVEPVTDYRTRWSGLRARNIRCGIPFIVAQEQIAAILKDKVVVGHAVHNDFRVMEISHPVHFIRDTASCKLLREKSNLPGNVCALRKLSAALLDRKIQTREHCSVTDARASLDLFRLVRTEWEPILKTKFERKQERYTGVKAEATEHQYNKAESQPMLNSFLDDKYWPDDIFDDSSTKVS